MVLFERLRPIFGIAALLLLMVGMWLVLNVPDDFQQGRSVRILYVHVPSAKMSLLAYLVLVGAAIMVLWKKSENADILAEAVVPVGAGFTLVTLCAGAIWGKPMWGTWWAWDARLTSMLVLLIIFIGLMALRDAIEDPVKSAKATAILALVGFVDLPIIHFSVVWWRTLHQPPSVQGGGQGKIAIVGPLLTPLIVMSIAFVAMGLYMLSLKAAEVRARRQLEALRDERFADE